jgi:hypothetical protein
MKRRARSIAGTSITIMSAMGLPVRNAVVVPLALVLAALGITLGAASSAQAAAGKPLLDPGCTEQTSYSSSVSSSVTSDKHTVTHTATQYGWYGQEDTHICVGQIDYSENFANSAGLAQRIRIRIANGAILYDEYNSGSKTSGDTINFDPWPVQEEFPYSSVLVCSALVLQKGYTAVPGVPIVCKKLS